MASKRFYIYGNGGICRVSHATIRAWRPDDAAGYLLDMDGVRELSSRENYRTNRWSKLPEGICEGYDDDGRLMVWAPDVYMVHYDDIECELPYWQTLI